MDRVRSHLEAELQNLEAEKNRVIEEAFIRAESEMKAVHENLAGETPVPVHTETPEVAKNCGSSRSPSEPSGSTASAENTYL